MVAKLTKVLRSRGLSTRVDDSSVSIGMASNLEAPNVI
jgi:hypothetical protein